MTTLTKTAEQWADLATAKDALTKLREPFPASQVGKLPKPYRKDAQKGECAECGKYHGLPAMHLDFVGHGAITDRLLEVDPFWSWEPFATGPDGLPALDRWGNLWIRLTVCGVTRIGVGDGSDMKVLIGDALRNAAMRFGAALDLWIRGSEDDKQHDGEQIAPAGPSADAVNAAADLDALPDEVAQEIQGRLETKAGVRMLDALEDKGWRDWLAGAVEHATKKLAAEVSDA